MRLGEVELSRLTEAGKGLNVEQAMALALNISDG
jgi:hypothetical protein